MDCRGVVKKLNATGKNTGTLGSILIDGPQDKNVSYNKASVSITDKTKIDKLVGKERKPANFADLKVGMKVQAKFTGPVAELSVQACAAEILILDAADNKEK